MKNLPKGKFLIIIFSILLILTMAVIIPLSFIKKEPKKQLVTLNKTNFETYFDVEKSFSQINGIAQIEFSISPLQNYAAESQSNPTIKITFAINFYKYSGTSGTPIKTEYIRLTLLKSKQFKKISSNTITVPENAKGYKIYISYINGTIYT